MQRGMMAKPVIEISSIEGLKELVRLGCGVSLMPPALLLPDQHLDDLALVPLADVAETFMFALIYRRGETLSVPARQFMHLAIQTTAAS